MNIQEKIKQLERLDKIPYPSDQEIDERIKIKEEIDIMMNENKPEITIQETVQTKPVELKKQKRTLYEVIQDYRKRKKEEHKATWDEIQQLKLEAIKERLKKDIAVSKSKQREMKRERMNSILNMVSIKPAENQPKKKPRASKTEQTDSSDELRALLGSNEKTKYKDLLG